MPESARAFSDSDRGALLAWFDANARDLPWRRRGDAYSVWVSEIMLQQTQVATAIPYFERWMARFPTIEALAAADEESALALWQGLGYYRRCKMLLAGARFVASNGWPKCAREWLRVPGVGWYTAGAIESIAENRPEPIVDGNVRRVFARLTLNASSGAALDRAAWKWAESAVDPARPGAWNQALMELGATVCRPANPDCAHCPLAQCCAARVAGCQASLPTKSAKRQAIRLRQETLAPWCDGRFGVRRIEDGPWWVGMWEFPRRTLETGAGWPVPELEGCETIDLGTHRHTVTNHRIELRAALAVCESRFAGLEWRSAEELGDLPMPAPQRRVLAMARERIPS